jgi:hypothetical protein
VNELKGITGYENKQKVWSNGTRKFGTFERLQVLAQCHKVPRLLYKIVPTDDLVVIVEIRDTGNLLMYSICRYRVVSGSGRKQLVCHNVAVVVAVAVLICGERICDLEATGNNQVSPSGLPTSRISLSGIIFFAFPLLS